MPAHDLEAAVIERVATRLRDRSFLSKLLAERDGSAAALTSAIALGAAAGTKLNTLYGKRSLVGMLVRGVMIQDERIAITLDRHALLRTLGATEAGDTHLIIIAPAVRVRHGKDVRLILADDACRAAGRDDALVALLAEAQAARAAVIAASDKSIKQLASETGQCSTWLTRLVRLSWLAPELVEQIANGDHSRLMTPRKLLDAELPSCWSEQRAMLARA